MDQRERIQDETEVIRVALEDFAANLWVAMPGIVQSFNATQGTCVVQVAIKPKVLDKSGNSNPTAITVIQDVPVVFLGGGSFVTTFPIQSGDEALIVFCNRCIDSWWQSGGVQVQSEIRYQDLSDAIAIIGPRSLAKSITNISTTTAQLRTLDGSCYLELASGGVINIVAHGGVNLNGDLVATGEITAKNTHTVSAHTHSDPQGGNTGTPTG